MRCNSFLRYKTTKTIINHKDVNKQMCHSKGKITKTQRKGNKFYCISRTAISCFFCVWFSFRKKIPNICRSRRTNFSSTYRTWIFIWIWLLSHANMSVWMAYQSYSESHLMKNWSTCEMAISVELLSWLLWCVIEIFQPVLR